MILQAMEIVRIGILFPFFSLMYILAPHSKIGQTMRKPFIKFICNSASYLTFLCKIYYSGRGAGMQGRKKCQFFFFFFLENSFTHTCITKNRNGRGWSFWIDKRWYESTGYNDKKRSFTIHNRMAYTFLGCR